VDLKKPKTKIQEFFYFHFILDIRHSQIDTDEEERDYQGYIDIIQ